MPPPAKKPVPSIAIGPCVWMTAPGGEPAAALVTKPGSVISVIVFPTESRVGVVCETVRYVGDPDLPKYAHLNLGCWDYTDDQKKLWFGGRSSPSTPSPAIA